MEWDKNRYLDIIQNTRTIKEVGRITEIIGLTIESDGPKSSIGDLCYIYNEFNQTPTMAEVVGFKRDRILLMPLASPDGIRPGAFVVNSGGAMKIGVGNQLIGRVLDGLAAREGNFKNRLQVFLLKFSLLNGTIVLTRRNSLE